MYKEENGKKTLLLVNITNMIKFYVCGDTTPPKRNCGHDAGVDFFVPNLTERFVKDLTEANKGHPYTWGLVGAPDPSDNDNEGVFIYVPPHSDILIPTYVKALIPDNEVLMMTNKSSVATKHKLVVGADTIDSSYEGIIHVHLINSSNTMRFIGFGDKICQGVPIVIDNEKIEVYYDESIEKFSEYKNTTTVEKFYEGHNSDRGEKGFGEGTGTT